MPSKALENIVPEINRVFSSKFGFASGYVKAWINKTGDFNLRIGKRDLQVDKEGKFIGSGTTLGKR